MNQYNTDFFLEDLKELDITLSEKQLEQFLRYYELLVEWNERMNLTAITEYRDVLKKHFVDSLSLTKAYDMHPALAKTEDHPLSLIDIGTGAGFPGLALKIAFPGLAVTLLDSLNKRVQFLDAVIGELGLEGVNTVHGRAEDYAKPEQLRERFDLCVSRAVARLSTLSEYCLPFVKQGGVFVAYKSEKASEEVAAAEKAFSLLGGQLERRVEFELPNSDIHRDFVLVKKIKTTPKKFPRKAGLPGREPL